MKKRLASLLLCVVMVVSMAVVPAQASYVPQYTAEAETLYELGLFKGTGTNPDGTPIFSLQNKATRLQALIILIRLLGLEDEALATTAANPFSDVPNTGTGPKYAAYAYETGLTNGIGGGKFGNTNVTPAQFVTFVLRALGYDDKAGDFKVATAIQKGREIGLITEDMLTSGSTTLLRDECVKINYNALKTKMKDSDKTLSEKLIADGVLTEKAVGNSGLMNTITYLPIDANYQIKCADIKKLFPEACGVSFCSEMTDDADKKYLQGDFSAESLMLGQSTRYCSGRESTMKRSSLWQHRPGEMWQTHASPAHMDWILLYDKEAHLIGYAMCPPWGYKDRMIPFVSCHIDLNEEIEQLKKDTNEAYENAVEFKMDALRTESVTTLYRTERGTEYERSVRTLFVDREKLPESVRDFKYYAFFWQRDDNKERAVKQAWCEVEVSPLLDTDFTPFRTIDQTVPSGFLHRENPTDILMLYDENKTMLGYCVINKKLADTETIVDARQTPQ